MATRSVSSSRFLVINNPGSLLFNASNAKATATMDFTRSAGQSFSAGCWFKRIGKPIDANGFTLIGVRNGSGAGDLWKLGILQNLTLTFNYDPTGGGEAINSDMSTDSSWHHLVGTYDGASLKLYLDGVLIKTGTSKTTAAIDQTNFSLGIREDFGTEDFVGLLKECFVSTYSLTLAEIQDIYYKNVYDLTRITHLWKLNDASGTSAVDTKGTLNLTISAATWNADIPGHMTVRSAATNRFLVRDMGTCLLFSGAGRIDATTLGNFGSNISSGLSLGCWLNTKITTAEDIFGVIHASGRIRFNINTDNFGSGSKGKLGLELIGSDAKKDSFGTTNAIPNLSDGNWHFVVATYNATTHEGLFYFDGIVIATSNGTAAAPTTWANFNKSLYVGALNNNGTASNFFIGMMDDIIIYNKVLTPTEILDFYYRNKPPTSSVSVYKLNEGSGSTAIDSSGNGNTGTITSATYSTNVFIKSRSTV